MILETHSTRAAKTKSMQNNIHTSIAVRHSAWINRERDEVQKDLQGRNKLPQVNYGLYKSHIGTWMGAYSRGYLVFT